MEPDPKKPKKKYVLKDKEPEKVTQTLSNPENKNIEFDILSKAKNIPNQPQQPPKFNDAQKKPKNIFESGHQNEREF